MGLSKLPLRPVTEGCWTDIENSALGRTADGRRSGSSYSDLGMGLLPGRVLAGWHRYLALHSSVAVSSCSSGQGYAYRLPGCDWLALVIETCTIVAKVPGGTIVSKAADVSSNSA